MGFFADIVSDSHYSIRRSSNSQSDPAADVANSKPPKQSFGTDQIQPVSPLDNVLVHDAEPDAPASRQAEKRATASFDKQSNTTEAIAHNQRTATAPLTKPRVYSTHSPKRAFATTEVQRKAISTPPLLTRKTVSPKRPKQRLPDQHDLLPTAKKSADLTDTTPQVGAEDTNLLSSSIKKQPAVEQPSRAENKTPDPHEASVTDQAQGGNNTVTSAVVEPAEGTSTVFATTVELQSASAPFVGPSKADPMRPNTAAKVAPPQVSIGQVNVIVEAPAKMSPTPASSSVSGDLASRTFLRSL